MSLTSSLLRRARTPLLVLALAPAMSCSVAAKTLEVGPDKTYKLPSAAIAAAGDGDKILIAAGEYFDCAIVPANNLTIEGTGPDASAVMTDKTCGGKGLLVTTGKNITVRNLTLTRARVPDGNGAGIRSEGEGLTVERVKFVNNQNGLLANPTPQGQIIIRNSEFIRNGACNPACAHGIYVNELALLRIENSKFTETRNAHHIKSRAARTEVIGCDISDGPNGTASYEIDIPNGGSLVLRDSRLEKGPKAENHSAAISIGAEGVNQMTREITIANNSFRNAGNFPTTFVVNMTATEAMLKGNKLSGTVEPLKGDGEVQ
ncbi:right-handed parallel beta-helix repeat-containing protein [Limobrevibacterium gyesilva]|uniref:Right-handed parallel beta-helix repeat-containing protein n=1 Tax=Limobrevibacterium gyesilva TaxID=2991712 RepID=A0AA41YQ98_9PROT|nr:right-handed parallel beta-helix repeat-containing protein [Limobrevibacterium gyesilva]MCW3476880.1 right-handed parallel beta-helix repeat-containing protein [Limobrevibacterium gyesilva]